jgi:hypothetical protein
MPESIDGLSEAKRALLERELAKRRRRLATPTIRPSRADEPPVLSQAQRRLWFLDRMSPGQATYNATLTMGLDGDLDPDALHWALDEIVRRHETLRTVGVDDGGGQPSAVVLDTGIGWQYDDLRDIGGEQQEELKQRLRADARQPFDLQRDVLLRAHLYRRSDDGHVLILVLHHIASDGWSRGILFSELAALYNARVAGDPYPLAPLAIQYSDFARWQDELIASGGEDADIEFWRNHLAGADLVLDLPTDRARPSVPSSTGERVGLEGGPESGDELRALARSEGATLFMALLAVSGVFLKSLTGQDDFLVGSPIANRTLPELEGLIGFFVNTLVLRIPMSGDPTFRELLRRCRESAIASLAHQNVSFDRLVEAINPKRIPGRNPLFQVNYRMQGVAPPTPELIGVRSFRLLTETGTARFDLALGFVDQSGSLRGYIEFNDALFDRETAEHWQSLLVELTAMLVSRPDDPLSVSCAVISDAVAARRQQRQAAAAGAVGGRRIRTRGA